MSYAVEHNVNMTSMKPMHRPTKPPEEKFPKHVVPNTSLFGKTGITISAEEKTGTKDGLAELEVLKAILNREGYLERLHNVSRTVGKKYKPEVSDVLDFVRASSLDVVDMILRWREAKVVFFFVLYLYKSQFLVFHLSPKNSVF